VSSRRPARGGCAISAPLTRDAAINLLAGRLHRKLGHIDPTNEVWSELRDDELDVWRYALRFVFDAPRNRPVAAMSHELASDNVVGGTIEICEQSESHDDKPI
jgi:hypothetical protein